MRSWLIVFLSCAHLAPTRPAPGSSMPTTPTVPTVVPKAMPTLTAPGPSASIRSDTLIQIDRTTAERTIEQVQPDFVWIPTTWPAPVPPEITIGGCTIYWGDITPCLKLPKKP
jgi:hypothetical protein